MIHGTSWRADGPTAGGQMVLWLHRPAGEGQAIIPVEDLATLPTEGERRTLIAGYWRQLRTLVRALPC